MTPRRLTLLQATLAMWFVAWAVWTADVLVETVAFPIERAARRLPLCLFGALLCLALARVLWRTRRKSTRSTAVVAVVGVVACSVLFALANEVIFYLIAPRWGPSRLVHIPDVAMLDGWVFLAWTLLYFALAADAERRDRALRMARAEAATLDAQHRLLVHQSQPHFIFNALNAIYALALEKDAEAVGNAILTLSGHLRRSLSAPSVQTTLGEELLTAGEYLAIERLRFGDRLQVREDFAGADLNAPIPSLIVQPLVENSIRHGLSKSAEVVTVWVRASSAANGHVVEIEDDALPVGAAPGTGIGLASVRRRVEAWGDGSGRVEAGRTGRGFHTIVRLPASP